MTANAEIIVSVLCAWFLLFFVCRHQHKKLIYINIYCICICVMYICMFLCVCFYNECSYILAFNFYFLAIKQAQETAKKDIKLFGSPWAAPAWMKTNKKMQHPGKLIGNVSGEYYKTWANYFVRFLQEYEKNGVKFWGLTVENEPSAGLLPR